MRKVISGIAICAMAFSVSAKDVDVEQVVQDSLFDGIYAGLGIGGSFLKTDGVLPLENVYEDISVDADADRFSGSVVVGAGKVINKVYGGFEVLFDIAKNKNKGWSVKIPASGSEGATPIEEHNCDCQVGMKGFFPQVNLKAGYSFTHDTIVYGKLGCAWSKVSLDYNHAAGNATSDPASSGSSSKTKASIVLGVGAEKVFNNRFSTSLEVDYNFGGSYKVTTGTEGGSITKERKLNMNKGWSVRALAKYNVKI